MVEGDEIVLRGKSIWKLARESHNFSGENNTNSSSKPSRKKDLARAYLMISINFFCKTLIMTIQDPLRGEEVGIVVSSHLRGSHKRQVGQSVVDLHGSW